MNQLTEIRGIGEKTAGAFARLGILRAEDLLRFYPRDYDCFQPPKPLYALEIGRTEAVEGMLQKDASLNRFNGLSIVNAYLADMTGRLQLSWYNAPYLRQTLKAGAEYVFRGPVSDKNGRLVMAQPKLYRIEDYKENYVGRMMPVYPLTKGLTNKTVMKAAAAVLKEAEAGELPSCMQEFLPERLLSAYGLLPLSEAIRGIHFPKDEAMLAAARRRLCFDEFFLFLLLAARLREETKRQTSVYRCKPDVRLIKFIADLPFELTAAQRAAWKEIFHDLSSGKVMNRLVEGDVGSGKTIVAILALMQTAFSGYEAALMAPTEVLARQHYETITKLFDETGISLRVLLVTGAMTKAEKRVAYEAIAAHEADIIIGTHALFQEAVVYDQLGLVVTDEQHRFGVGQREALRGKGKLPHMLVMSATPIPRTLAIILYGDLDVSLIDKLPEGRLPIKNCVVGTGERMKSYRFLLSEIKKGRQCYVICPAVEPAEEEAAFGTTFATADANNAGSAGVSRRAGIPESAGVSKSVGVPKSAGAPGSALAQAPMENVTDYAEKLRNLFPPDIRIGILHGKMKPAEKDAVMQRFKAGEIDLLVATTVVEVGVDVPNASVMMIENAERFGLAQLHQLRGRVGRGKEQSYCIMINASDSERAQKRLDILNHSNDGFYIASEDLKLRGPGELFGLRQSGELSFALADIYRDAALLKEAKEACTALLSEDVELKKPEHKKLKEKLDAYLEGGFAF